jgi:5-methylcytosine-specific restriction endonuclease McrA
MSNKYGIPKDELLKIRERDTKCVYCNNKMLPRWDTHNRRNSPTIEHLSPVKPFYMKHGMQLNNIAICCGSCNSSRRDKTLTEWFEKRYCREKNNINADTVLAPVKAYLKRLEQDKG